MQFTIRTTAACLLIVCLFLQGCAAVTMKPPEASPTNSPAPILPTSTRPAPTQTASAIPIQPSPPATATLAPEAIRETPSTLMLHRKSYAFDAPKFLNDFISLLKHSGMQVTTYRELNNNPDLSLTQKGKLFIFTIDDIYLRYPIEASVLEMIHMLREAGYPAVLGVITESDYAYPETVKTLKELQNLGWEVASHSDNHINLANMEKVAPKSIYLEIKTSLDKLEAALGLRPVTLILPEGQMTHGDQQIKRSGVSWVVGIGGGNQYDTSVSAFHYVGREGPDGSAQETLAIIRKRFAP